MADRLRGIDHQSVDGTDRQAAAAVVAEQGIDLVGDGEARRLGDRSDRAGRLTGPAAEALLVVDLKGHDGASTVAGDPAASKTAWRVPMKRKNLSWPMASSARTTSGSPKIERLFNV